MAKANRMFSDAQLLYALQWELPSMRSKLAVVRLINDYDEKHASRNALLNFLLNQASNHVIEWLLNRSAEAIHPVMQNAHRRLLSRDLVKLVNRRWASTVSEFQVALHLRHVYIGHRVMNSAETRGGPPAEVAPYGGIYPFLERLLNRLEQAIGELEAAGLFEGQPDLHATSTETPIFATEDLRSLIVAANTVATPERWLSLADQIANRQED